MFLKFLAHKKVLIYSSKVNKNSVSKYDESNTTKPLKSGKTEKNEEPMNQNNLDEYSNYLEAYALKLNPVTLKFIDEEMISELIKKKGNLEARQNIKNKETKKREMILKSKELIPEEGLGGKAGILYYLTALDLKDKRNYKILIKNLNDLNQRDPINLLSLLTEKIPSTFLHLFIIEKLSKLSTDFLISCIPFFLGSLLYCTNAVSPITAFLVEMSCEYPLTVKLTLL